MVPRFIDPDRESVILLSPAFVERRHGDPRDPGPFLTDDQHGIRFQRRPRDAGPAARRFIQQPVSASDAEYVVQGDPPRPESLLQSQIADGVMNLRGGFAPPVDPDQKFPGCLMEAVIGFDYDPGCPRIDFFYPCLLYTSDAADE